MPEKAANKNPKDTIANKLKNGYKKIRKIIEIIFYYKE